MTRNHLEVIAAEIKKIADKEARLEAAVAVSRAMQAIKPKTDITWFLQACNVI